MACCFLCFSKGSKYWIPLLLAVFASFSSSISHLFASVPILLLLFLLLLSFRHSKQRTILKKEPQMKPSAEKNTIFCVPSEEETTLVEEEEKVEENNESEEIKEEEAFLPNSQGLSSESESLDHFSSSSSEDHSSDIEWPYSMEQRLDCSDDSISDEESLIEIAIPSGEFVSPEKSDPMFNLKYCKDFLTDMNEINEEDNLIEIDIYMGSIKCSSFEI